MGSIAHPFRELAALAVLSSAMFLQNGCVHSYRLKVDAIHDPDASVGQSFRIVERGPATAPANEAKHEAMVAVVQSALSQRGLYPAPAGQPADVEVEVDVRVSAPRQRVQRVDNPDFEPPGSADRPGNDPRAPGPGEMHPPIRILGGGGLRVTEVYEKQLVLVAREPKREGPGAAAAEIWRVQVSVENEGDQVEEVLPVLARTAAEHIGKDVRGKEISAQIAENTADTNGPRSGW